jgi:hypothetical protein
MVMESFDHMFEDFISLCIVGCIVMQRFSYLLMISLEVVNEDRPDMTINWSFN